MIDEVVELIRRASTDLPKDVEERIRQCMGNERKGSMAYNILGQILMNVEIARRESVPICQDTGTNIFYIDYPSKMKEKEIERRIREAVRIATRKYYLRPNSVETLTNKNTGNNIGIGHPSLHFRQWDRDYLRMRLMLKGGGCENVGMQYKLPDARLAAGRDLAGVEKCIIDAVLQAQGKGCAPGAIGVCAGADRGYSYVYSKEQFFRKLTDKNKNPVLAKLETSLMKKLNTLGIGPMGLGGKTTVLGVKIGVANRVPACYFVSVSYMCWAYRRSSMTIRRRVVKYD